MFKTTILACSLAALVGCRERAIRVDDETSFSRPVESDRTFETPGSTEEHTTVPPTVETPALDQVTRQTTNELEPDDDADTSSIPTRGGTNGISSNGISSDPRADAGDTSGAGARSVPPPTPDAGTPLGEGQGQNTPSPAPSTGTDAPTR